MFGDTTEGTGPLGARTPAGTGGTGPGGTSGGLMPGRPGGSIF